MLHRSWPEPPFAGDIDYIVSSGRMGTWRRASLDRDADLAHARKRTQLGDAQLHALRAELGEHERGDRFGERLEQRVAVGARERADAGHNGRIVDRVGKLA